MAGDWIAFDHDLPDKEEVLAIVTETGESVAETVLRLCRLWCWFDRMTEDGKMRYIGVTGVTLKCGGNEEFWAAVEKVGWIKFGGEDRKNVSIPGFGARFGNSARRRLLTAKRVTLHRLRKKCNDVSVTTTLQNASQQPQPQPQSLTKEVREKPPVSLTIETLMPKWNALEGVRKALIANKTRRTSFKARMKEPAFRSFYEEAMAKFPLKCFSSDSGGWTPDLEWFLRPNTVISILEGKYDWEKGAKEQDTPSPGSVDEPYPEH